MSDLTSTVGYLDDGLKDVISTAHQVIRDLSVRSFETEDNDLGDKYLGMSEGILDMIMVLTEYQTWNEIFHATLELIDEKEDLN